MNALRHLLIALVAIFVSACFNQTQAQTPVGEVIDTIYYPYELDSWSGPELVYELVAIVPGKDLNITLEDDFIELFSRAGAIGLQVLPSQMAERVARKLTQIQYGEIYPLYLGTMPVTLGETDRSFHFTIIGRTYEDETFGDYEVRHKPLGPLYKMEGAEFPFMNFWSSSAPDIIESKWLFVRFKE